MKRVFNCHARRAGLLLFILLVSCSTQDLSIVVENYEQAYNNHDLEKIMSFYADDAEFEVVNIFSLSGKDQIRNLTEYDIALDIQMSIENIKIRGDSAIFELTERNDWLKAMEIEAAHYGPTILIFKDGLIEHLKATQIPQTEEAISSAIQAIMKWASANRPEQIAEMMPEGEFVYSADNAKKVIELIQQWKETSKEDE